MPIPLGIVAVDGKQANPYWIAVQGTSTTSSNFSQAKTTSGSDTYTTMSLGATTDGAILIKQNLFGQIEWQRFTVKPATSGQFADDPIVDASGNIYYSAFSNPQGALISYSATGTFLSAKTFTGSIGTIVSDSASNIYLMGSYNYSTSDLGTYIVKYNSSGTQLFNRKLQSATFNRELSCDSGIIDSTGALYTASYHFVNNTSISECYLTKWDSSGNITWQRIINPYSGSRFQLLRVAGSDSSNNIYSIARANDTLISGNRISTLFKHDSSGNLIWQRSLTNPGIEYTHATVDPSGDVFITAGDATNANSPTYVIKYNTSGSVLWQRSIVTSSYDGYRNSAISLNSTGSAYILSTAAYTNSGKTTAKAVQQRFPTDGLRTGTYTSGAISWNYSATTLTTEAAGTGTSAVSSLAAATGNFAEVTNTFTSNGTPTQTLVQIAV